MYKDFAKTHILCWILKLTLAFFTIAICFYYIFRSYFIIESTKGLVPVLAGVFLLDFFLTFWSTIFCNFLALKEYQKILQILQMDCDPYAYVETYYPIATKRSKTDFLNQMKYNNLSVGYIGAGQWDTAINMLQSIHIKDKNKRAAYLQYVCFMNLCHCYLYKGDIEAAKFYLSNATSSLTENFRKNKKLMAVFREAYDTNVHHLEILQGEFDSARSYFEQALHTVKNMEKRVEAAYLLAYIYNKTGETEKKQEMIHYVKQHGNKLAFVKLVEELE